MKQNPTTWENTDTRLDRNDFYTQNLNQDIATRESGGDFLIDVMRYLSALYDDGSKWNFSDRHDLMITQEINRKYGPLGGRISTFLICGENQMNEAQVKVGKIGESMQEFVRDQEEGMNLRRKNYQRIQKAITKRYKICGLDVNRFCL